MGQDQSSVFDLAAVAAASNGGNNDPLLPPARFIGEPQKPSKMPYNKYVAYDKQVPFDYPERTWPGKRLQRAPRWCSVDLRDGNQALVNPMDSERKLRFWNMLISMRWASRRSRWASPRPPKPITTSSDCSSNVNSSPTT